MNLRRQMVRPIRIRVHERSNKRLDGILQLIDDAAQPQNLQDLEGVLDTMCAQVAHIARTDVVSVYIIENDADDPDGHALVMRANVGLAARTPGTVRLAPGEGITSMVAECLRPISVAVAQTDAQYKHVTGIGEERFPAYLGLPLLVDGTVAGVLVLQRREAREYAPAEIALATALAAPFSFAIERARRKQTQSAPPVVTHRPIARAARLTGRGLASGLAIGRVQTMPALPEDEVQNVAGRPGDNVALAFSSLARGLDQARRKVEHALPPALLSRLRALAAVLEDRRLRDLAISESASHGIVVGMRKVARQYARAAFRSQPSHDQAWIEERTLEIEELCTLVASQAAGEQYPSHGSVVVAEKLTAFLVLAAVARGATAIAIACPSPEDCLGTALVRAANLPCAAEVGGLFAWSRPGDRVLVDGDSGLVRINPPATAIARYRRGS